MKKKTIKKQILIEEMVQEGWCTSIWHKVRSSTIRHGNGRVWFHLGCSQEGDPITDVEVEAESAKYG